MEKFDKFIFNIPNEKNINNSVIVGFPDDFSEAEKLNTKKIKIGTEEIFYIKESATITL